MKKFLPYFILLILLSFVTFQFLSQNKNKKKLVKSIIEYFYVGDETKNASQITRLIEFGGGVEFFNNIIQTIEYGTEVRIFLEDNSGSCQAPDKELEYIKVFNNQVLNENSEAFFNNLKLVSEFKVVPRQWGLPPELLALKPKALSPQQTEGIITCKDVKNLMKAYFLNRRGGFEKNKSFDLTSKDHGIVFVKTNADDNIRQELLSYLELSYQAYNYSLDKNRVEKGRYLMEDLKKI